MNERDDARIDALKYALWPESISSTTPFFTDSTCVFPFATARVSPRPVERERRCRFCGRKHQPEQEICKGCGGVL